jgi:SAM-dependent methyltransferase
MAEGTSGTTKAPQRRAMAGQLIPVWHILRNGLKAYWIHRRYRSREIRTCLDRFRFLSDKLARHTGRSLASSRILDVGCGQRALMPLLFAAHGAEAYGVDVERPTYQFSAKGFLRILRESGVDRALKSLARHVLFDRGFFKDLGIACGIRLQPFPKVTVWVADAARLDLPADYFDMVFSFAVLEHVADVESVVTRIAQVLRPEGVGYLYIHLFPSLSGGHCADWQYAMDPAYPECGVPKAIPPWDHLRDNRFPANTYLNKLRLADYRQILERHTTVLDESTVLEGTEMLRLAPPSLLDKYSAEDLTTSVVMFTVRKKQ